MQDFREQARLKKLGTYIEPQRNSNVTVLDPEQRNKGAAKQLERSNGEVYLCPTLVELYTFDEAYLELLRRGDRAKQDHFVRYFGKLLRIKLRSRKLPAHVIKDIQQETFLRVLVAVRTGEIRQADRLGPYVNSVCNNILLEYYRVQAREHHVDLEEADGPDATADLEAQVIEDEKSRRVRAIINQLSEREQVVLRALLLDRDKDEVCQELGVNRGYFRVLVHRAVESFRDRF
jgi:RNA polymerase sigma-70 factor (ECF subfamily)